MNEENVMTTNEQEERMPFFRIPKAILTDEKYACIFREICASVPKERSAIPLETERSSAD